MGRETEVRFMKVKNPIRVETKIMSIDAPLPLHESHDDKVREREREVTAVRHPPLKTLLIKQMQSQACSNHGTHLSRG